MFCIFVIKRVSHRHSSRVSQAMSQSHLESVGRRSEIMSNVPFAFDKMGHAQVFHTFFASEGHMTSDSACTSFMAWLKCMSTCQCRCREEGGWSFCGVFAVCFLLWWAPCPSVQACLVVQVWLLPHCVCGTDLWSHFRTPGAAQKQGRKVCPPTVCGRPFRTPFRATDR